MNPIFEVNGAWYFWDETESWDYGPYQTKELAMAALQQYCKQILGN